MPLCQKELNVPRTEAERVIHPYSMAGNLREEAMAVVWIGGVLMPRKPRPLPPRFEGQPWNARHRKSGSGSDNLLTLRSI
jgi:hypothetical protein